MDKKTLLWFGGWLLFQILFWFVGKPHQMGPVTAFFVVNGLTLVYAAAVYWANKILKK